MLNILGVHGLDQCHATPLIVNPRAEARFSVILSIRQRFGNRECAEISQEALQILSSIQWAVNKINAANYVPGMSVGMYALNMFLFTLCITFIFIKLVRANLNNCRYLNEITL